MNRPWRLPDSPGTSWYWTSTAVSAPSLWLLDLDTAGFFRLHPQVNQKFHRPHAPLFQLAFHRPPGGAAAPEEDDGLFSLGNNDSG